MRGDKSPKSGSIDDALRGITIFLETANVPVQELSRIYDCFISASGGRNWMASLYRRNMGRGSLQLGRGCHVLQRVAMASNSPHSWTRYVLWGQRHRIVPRIFVSL